MFQHQRIHRTQQLDAAFTVLIQPVVNLRIRPPSAERDHLDKAKVVERVVEGAPGNQLFRSQALIGHTNTRVV